MTCFSTNVWKHDVFLNFRGLDTRNNFTSLLFVALEKELINTYRDDKKLQRGKDITGELIKAIEESRFAVAVISKDYASSGWCLDELVMIIQCQKYKGLTLLPVFYDVEPSHLLNLEEGSQFGNVFREKVAQGNVGKEEEWRKALSEVAGVHPQWSLKDRDQSEVIGEIVGNIRDILSPSFASCKEHVIGIDSRLSELELLLDAESGGVCTVGIFGKSGIGKTTIATEVFEKIHRQFKIGAFFSDVSDQFGKHKSLTRLQEHLFEILFECRMIIQHVSKGKDLLRTRLCSMNALIILDNVSNLDQVEALVGKAKEKNNWFGKGSRIILTTSNEELLKKYGVGNKYEVGKLNKDEALEFFCERAFKQNYPKYGYEDLSQKFVQLADGLPSVLDEMGGFLSGIEKIEEWSDEFQRRTSNRKKRD